MSTYLLAPTEAAARLLERKAWAYCIKSLDCEGGNWSDVFTDGKRFAIVWSNQIQPALSDAELGTVTQDSLAGSVTTMSNVIDDDAVNWSVVPPPVPAP